MTDQSQDINQDSNQSDVWEINESNRGCPVMHGDNAVHLGKGQTANQHWWPNQLDLRMLHQRTSADGRQSPSGALPTIDGTEAYGIASVTPHADGRPVGPRIRCVKIGRVLEPRMTRKAHEG